MAWKQDLAKLKQQLAPEETAPAAKPKPKPAPKPEGPLILDDEDAVFLSAMGHKPTAKRPALAATEAQAATPTEGPRPTPESFQEAIQDLRGFKPMAKGLKDQPDQPKALPQVPPPPPIQELPAPEAPVPVMAVEVPHLSQPEPEPLATPESFQEAILGLRGFKPLAKGIRDQPLLPPPSLPPLPEPPEPAAPAPLPLVEAPRLSLAEPEPIPARPTTPTRFQLAAGMAIEVDGTLDLRGHTLADALDRRQDRLGDGQVLGWRSLQVTLGQEPMLHEGLLNLMASGQVPMVARYAQAPVPMGGNQAWLLYFAAPTAQP